MKIISSKYEENEENNRNVEMTMENEEMKKSGYLSGGVVGDNRRKSAKKKRDIENNGSVSEKRWQKTWKR